MLNNGSSLLSPYEPCPPHLVFTQAEASPGRDFIGDSEFFTQQFSIDGASIQYICKVSSLSRTSVKDAIKRFELRRPEGGRIFHGQIPYGWKLEHGRLVKHKGEQEVIVEIKQMRELNKSLREIANYLNERGIPTKNLKKWQAATILRILRNR